MSRRASLTVLVLVTALACGLPAGGAEPERWLTDLRFPVNMAWTSDGTLFFAEKETGDVRMVMRGAVAPEPVAHVDVEVSFETGLLGIAAHPGWPDEPWLYLYYSDAADGINRLIRVRVEDGRETGRETLLDGLPTATAYHNGGDMTFGPDGMLYLTVGEAHEAERAQDPDDLGGKVLRLTPEGEVPADNPFPGSPAFTLGHRNSFGICVDPTTEDLWETENGPSGGDEVNRLVAGANYGWPVAMGPLEDERYTDPFAFFAETVVPTGCAVWRGSLHVATYGDGLLRRYPLDPPDPDAGIAFEFGEPVFDVAVGPDGRLYASTSDTIWRFGSAPASTPGRSSPTTETPGPTGAPRPSEGDTPAWVVVTIAVALALTLAATLRFARRR